MYKSGHTNFRDCSWNNQKEMVSKAIVNVLGKSRKIAWHTKVPFFSQNLLQ